MQVGALGSGSERGRRANGTCSVQRPKSWLAARAAPVRLKVAEGITAAARAPAFRPPWPVMIAAAREALDAGLGRTAGTPSLPPPSLAPTLWPRPQD